QRRRMNYNYVGPGFLETLQVPIVLGRGIEQRDMSSGVRVAVMNETAARRAFGSASPLGGRFRYSDKDPFVEVVGVARDSQYDRIRNEPMAVTFIPYTQTEFGWLQSMNFEVRTASDTAFTTAAIRAAVHEFDRMLPLLDVKTMETQLDEALAQQRLFAALVSLFGSITLALACVGLYGAVSYSVARRTREIGVRIAMGASRMAVLRLILAQVAVTTAAGLLIGIPATRALTRLVASQLYGIQPQDPLSLAGAAVAVVAIAMVAALVPARRAMRVDPVRALRCE
ncbi:MAG TPA: FtsX-like permease family protein, partial [Bryobacteraceae bacterium]|nr:FtsX-like permease family protein [Bryobacteraceae bacterium]